MKPLLFAVAGVAALATPLSAFDLSTVETRTIHGLEGPTGARMIAAAVIGTRALAEEGIESLAGHSLRTRFWTILGDDGIVPIHAHDDRPAVFTILTSEIWEYTTKSAERVRHTAGGLALEEGELAHWWLNDSCQTVHLIAFDVFRPGGDAAPLAPVPETAAFDMPPADGVTHELLGVVDIGAHFDDGTGAGYGLTTYRTTIAPGGTFAAFGAGGAPLQVFVWQGEVTEHRSDADAPATLSEREGSAVDGGARAYWTNTGARAAVLYFGAVEPLAEVAGLPRTGRLAHGSHGE